MVLERHGLARPASHALARAARRGCRRIRCPGLVDLAPAARNRREAGPTPHALRPALAHRLRRLLRLRLRRLGARRAHAPVSAGRVFLRATDALVVHGRRDFADAGV